ncbi:MAG TPA: peptidoglycan DD-metalloendopeptidase family protein [Brachybacterium paraconglomeratum]|uniref:Peptidoglycan DD-metalloendopeptidase family protein n=1 Tax=Brachybacterium paraconglomeratum TaxID=173362 RepID=A0A921KTT4_9MICO|nr:peptidoglycan DD-metalloendopeptidase family protein [Brachybacterium paraconglomeratum]
MARSDAAWVDVLPQMKGFAAPLMKGVKDASKKAGTEGGRALVDGINAETKKADVSPVVQELEKVERAAKKAADEQATAARKAASEVGKSQTRIIDARDKERSAAANVERAEADLEKRRSTAASKSAEVERAERDIAARRASGEASTDELAKAELDLAGKRADSAKADAEVTASTAKLEGARSKLGQATEKVENEDIALRAAITESKVAHQEARDAAADHARAQDDLARETGQAAQEAEKALPAWKRLWSGMDGTGGLKKQIVNGMKGIGREVEKEAERIRSRGDALLGGIGKGVKWGAAGLAAGGAAFAGGALVGGFNRLADIEDARASLEGLQMSGAEVDKVMESALASVKGTAFGMGEAASVAATMTAAGIKPGEDLTNTLSLVADSATIAKRDIGDMGLIWSSVASKGKLQGDDAMQLLESGIPIWQMIGDVMGVTAAEAQELGSKGEVGFDVFAKAMEQNLGGAAQKSGETVRGSFANLKAAVSRLGASALEDFYPLIAPALRGVTAFVDGIGEKVTPYIETFSQGVRGVYDLLVNGDFTGALTEAFGWEEDSAAVDFLFRVRDGIKGIWDLVVGGDFTGALRDAFGWEEDHPAVGALLMLRDAAIEVGGWLRDNLIPILSGVGGFLLYLGGTAVVGAIMSLGGVISGALAAIGWIPLAIGAAVGVLTWFFTETELGAQVLQTAWEGIQIAIGAVTEWFTTTALPLIVAGFEWLQEAVGAVGEWFSTTLWPALQTGWDVLSAVAGEVIPVVVQWVQTLGDYWSQIVMGVVVPAIQQLVGYIRDEMFPIVQRLWTDYVQPVFAAIGAFIVWAWQSVIKPALGEFYGFLTNTLAPNIVWLWQNVVSPAFTTIGAIISWAWNSVIFPALDALKWFLTAIVGPTIVWLWQNVVVPAWSGISWAIDTAWKVIKVIFSIIDWTVRNVVGPVFSWLYESIIKPVWKNVQDVLERGWTFVRDHVFTPLKNFISNDVAPGFEKGVEAIGTAWDKLKGFAAKPVRFVIEDVINKSVIDPFNKVGAWFDPNYEDVKHLEMPAALKGYTTGGILPGQSSWRDGDDQLIAARRGEGVLVSEGLRDRESQSLFLRANHAARTAGTSFADFVSGFASGGLVKIGMPFRGSFPRGDGFGARSGRHKGIDWPMPSGTSLVAVGAGSASRTRNPAAGKKLELSIGNGLTAGYHHLSDFAVPSGAAVTAGQVIGYAGSTGRSSGPHLHFSLRKDGKYVDPLPYLGAGGAAGSGDDGGWWNPFAGLWDSIKETVRAGVGDTLWGDILFGMPKKLIGSALDWATGKLGEIGDWASDQVDTTVAGVKATRWTPTATRALTMENAFSGANLQALLRRMNQESGFDPRAVNNWDSNAKRGTPSKGLMQVIGPTFRAYARPGYDKDIFDPLSNILASIRYTRATYPSLAAGWNRRGGYAHGGLVGGIEPLVYDEGGWLKPGLSLVHNKSGVPEPVFTGKQGQSIIQMLEAGGTGGPSVTVPITATQLSDADVDRLADEIMRRVAMELESA